MKKNITNKCLQILEAIKEQEKEYCLDENYTNNELWKELFPKETREQVYNNTIKFWEDKLKEGTEVFLKEVFQTWDEEHFDYILNI